MNYTLYIILSISLSYMIYSVTIHASHRALKSGLSRKETLLSNQHDILVTSVILARSSSIALVSRSPSVPIDLVIGRRQQVTPSAVVLIKGTVHWNYKLQNVINKTVHKLKVSHQIRELYTLTVTDL